MSNTIESPANSNYDFGQQMDYSVWPASSQIDAVNVPWNNDYRDVVRFPTQPQFDAYISSLSSYGVRMSKMSYLKPNEPIRVDIPFNVINRYNYLRAQNPVQPVPGNDVKKNYYYFILGAKYIAPNTTELTLQLDVWSTYNFDVELGNCYVNRGHISIANTNGFNNYGRDYLTVPEGLDTGSDMVIVDSEYSPIIDEIPGTGGITLPVYNIVVTSTVDLIKDAGTVDSPKLNTASGGMFQGIISGSSIYAWKNQFNFISWLDDNADKPWVTQGIVSIAMVPSLENYYSGITWPTDLSKPLDVGTALVGKPSRPVHSMKNNWRNSSDILNFIPSKYRNLKKFLTSPYCVMELTCYQATPVVLRPELWNNANANVQEVTSFVAPAQRAMVYPVSYNTPSYQTTYRDVGEFIDVATLISNFPQAMTVNNSAIAYMANNAHGIAFSYQSADWSQQRALAGANTAQTVAQMGASAELQNAQYGMTANAAQAVNSNNLIQNQLGNNQLQSVLGGTIGGAGGGAFAGPGGMALGAGGGLANGVMQAVTMSGNANAQQIANSQSAAIANQATNSSAWNTNDTTYAIADTNKNFARFAAQGDYENAVAGIQAKLQDTKMLQPTTSGQISGDAFNIVNSLFGVTVKWKFIDKNHITMIGDYWLRYGYAVNRFIKFPSSFMVMTNFTYWKLAETYITSATIPEMFKQTIRGIFEKGVTVWSDPTKIGVINLDDNDPLPGVSY